MYKRWAEPQRLLGLADTEYAASTEWGRPLVDSTATLALVTGLIVPDMSEHGVNLGWDEVRLLKPVFAGDTIRAETEVLSKGESQSRPESGIVRVRTRGLTQRRDRDLVQARDDGPAVTGTMR